MLGKHSSFVDDLINLNANWDGVDLCGFSELEIKRYLMLMVSSQKIFHVRVMPVALCKDERSF